MIVGSLTTREGDGGFVWTASGLVAIPGFEDQIYDISPDATAVLGGQPLFSGWSGCPFWIFRVTGGALSTKDCRWPTVAAGRFLDATEGGFVRVGAEQELDPDRDGAIVDRGDRAFARYLEDVAAEDLELDLGGWHLAEASGVSRDGTVVGWGTSPAGATGAWLLFQGVDSDGDGLFAQRDNCPDLPNLEQENADGDAAGDVCDAFPFDPREVRDGDLDLVGDNGDNCPTVVNPEQRNTDGDPEGDDCDADDDNDGLGDPIDNCPLAANTDQEDSNGNELGDACDPDDDGDAVPDAQDNCRLIANVDQSDAEGDGVGDLCDNCRDLANPGQQDSGSIGTSSLPDGIGSACQCGDVNGTGSVTSTDGLFINRAMLGTGAFSLTAQGTVSLRTGPIFLAGRCNVTAPGPGVCSATDGLLVNRGAMGLPVPGLATRFAGLCPGEDFS